MTRMTLIRTDLVNDLYLIIQKYLNEILLIVTFCCASHEISLRIRDWVWIWLINPASKVLISLLSIIVSVQKYPVFVILAHIFMEHSNPL